MAVDRVIFNAGPLIALASANCLHLVHDLIRQPQTTSTVARELVAGTKPGHITVSLDGFEILDLGPVPEPILAVVDPGEASVIHAALRDPDCSVCLDDRRGRNLARLLAIPCFGALGLLLRAKQARLITAIRPMVDAMEAAGYYYKKVFVDGVLQGAGEPRSAGEDE